MPPERHIPRHHAQSGCQHCTYRSEGRKITASNYYPPAACTCECCLGPGSDPAAMPDSVEQSDDDDDEGINEDGRVAGPMPCLQSSDVLSVDWTVDHLLEAETRDVWTALLMGRRAADDYPHYMLREKKLYYVDRLVLPERRVQAVALLMHNRYHAGINKTKHLVLKHCTAKSLH